MLNVYLVYLLQGGETYHKWQAYGQSKTANILFSVSLAEKLGQNGLLAFSVHPGVVVTNLGRHMSEPDIASLRKSSFLSA